MPIYEFKCNTCDKRFEKLCSLGETGENVKCPGCGRPGPQRVMSSFFSQGNKDGNGVLDAGGSGGGCSGCSSTSCATCH